MTDRTNILTVALDHEMREDDVQCVIDAIKMIKYVSDVEINVSEPTEWFALQKARLEVRDKLWDVIYPK